MLYKIRIELVKFSSSTIQAGHILLLQCNFAKKGCDLLGSSNPPPNSTPSFPTHTNTHWRMSIIIMIILQCVCVCCGREGAGGFEHPIFHPFLSVSASLCLFCCKPLCNVVTFFQLLPIPTIFKFQILPSFLLSFLLPPKDLPVPYSKVAASKPPPLPPLPIFSWHAYLPIWQQRFLLVAV